jgi:hypothetical protein
MKLWLFVIGFKINLSISSSKLFLPQNFKSLKVLKIVELESEYVPFNSLLIWKYEKSSFDEPKNCNFRISISNSFFKSYKS